MSRIAEQTLARALGSADKARRLVLSLFFRAALGIERIFHFETLDDPGFAILSGGEKVMSRSRLGGLIRAVSTAGVEKLARATEDLRALRNKVVTLSLDEHIIARFTRKFKIPKGFHTIRNKKMRAEKFFTRTGPRRDASSNSSWLAAMPRSSIELSTSSGCCAGAFTSDSFA